MAPYARKYPSYLPRQTAIDELGEVIKSEYQQFLPYLNFEDDEPVLWIFGYGSLIWLPKVEYEKSEAGYVNGYAIRFWQGNTTHRGTPESPGRVATLIKDESSKTWGKAFQLRGVRQINEGLKHLCGREMRLGGYAFEVLQFQVQNSTSGQGMITAVTFVANPDNDLYLGPANVADIAHTIVNSKGKSGHNLEYLFRLTDSLRSIASDFTDPHLQSLERECHAILANKSGAEDEYVASCLCSRRRLIAASSDSALYNTFCNIKQD